MANSGKKVNAQLRSAMWLNQYLAMGLRRNLRDLATMDQQEADKLGLGLVPNLRTITEWSRKQGWFAEAQRYDADIARQNRERKREEQLREMEVRRSRRLQMNTNLTIIETSAILIPETDENGRRTGNVRVRTFAEFEPDELRALIALHRTIGQEERLDTGQPTSRNEMVGDEDRPIPMTIQPIPAELEQRLAYLIGNEEPDVIDQDPGEEPED